MVRVSITSYARMMVTLSRRWRSLLQPVLAPCPFTLSMLYVLPCSTCCYLCPLPTTWASLLLLTSLTD
jgi:hypothetical protein